MKILYDLSEYGVFPQDKIILTDDGVELRTSTLYKILSLITSKYFYSESEYVQNLYTHEFQQIVVNYLPYLNFLQDRGIMVRGKHWKQSTEDGKGYPKSIMFTDEFKNTCKIVKIEQQLQLPSDKFKPLKVYPDSWNFPVKLYHRIYKDYQLLELPEYIERKFYNDGEYCDFHGYLSDLNQYYNIKNGRNVFKWKNDTIVQDHRLYTPFVFISSINRTNFKVVGQRLVEFDIKSSFIKFLCIWMVKNGFKTDTYDSKEFFNIVRDGDIYKYIAHLYNKKGESFLIDKEPTKQITRNDMKEMLNSWLNGKHDKKFTELMKCYFPEIYEFIDNAKNGKDKGWLFRELSKLESDFIFNDVCQTLYDKIPDIHIITCHDAIYVPMDKKEMVSDIWNELNVELKMMIPKNVTF